LNDRRQHVELDRVVLAVDAERDRLDRLEKAAARRSRERRELRDDRVREQRSLRVREAAVEGVAHFFQPFTT
jgi:hypothetical protein